MFVFFKSHDIAFSVSVIHHLILFISNEIQIPWPHVHKAFQNKDQGQAQVNNSYIMDF